MKIAIGLALGLSILACSKAKSPAELEQGLDSPDPVVRKDSADGLRDGKDVPDEAVPKLMVLTLHEKDPDALSSELLTLGASGVLAARDTICTHYKDSDEHVANAADHAMTLWLRRNINENGCEGISGAGVQEVPVSEGPSSVPIKPKKPKSWTHDMK